MTSIRERRLNRNVTIILICGIFMTFCVILILSMCNVQQGQDQTYAIAHQMDHGQGQEFWQKHFLAPVKDQSATLIVIIISGPNNTRQRNTIRETWLSGAKSDCLIKFVIGVLNLPQAIKDSLERENFLHNDILLLSDYEESYHSLTDKILQSFIWFDQKVDFKYLLKVDDDSFVRLKILLNELKSKPTKRLYWGFFDGRAHVKKTGKWSEPDWILCDRYLPYALGGGYVISYDLVHFIVSNKEFLKKYISEDVSVGSWLASLDIQRIHDPRFDTEYMSRGCRNVYIITHKKSIGDMKLLHNNIQEIGQLCNKEKMVRKSYIYNWNVLPTQCCIRNDSNVP